MTYCNAHNVRISHPIDFMNNIYYIICYTHFTTDPLVTGRFPDQKKKAFCYVFTEPIKFLWNRKSVSIDPFVFLIVIIYYTATCLVHQRINRILGLRSSYCGRGRNCGIRYRGVWVLAAAGPDHGYKMLLCYLVSDNK